MRKSGSGSPIWPERMQLRLTNPKVLARNPEVVGAEALPGKPPAPRLRLAQIYLRLWMPAPPLGNCFCELTLKGVGTSWVPAEVGI
jgi:hypothetical protein